MKYYKLTDRDGYTRRGEYNECKWGEGVTHEATGTKSELCSNGWIHFYTSPLIAVIRNCQDADIPEPIMWECKIGGEVKHNALKHNALKSGAKRVTTVKRIALPEITTNQRVAFAILCSLEVYSEITYTKWAVGWLKGIDRTEKAANAANAAANAATNATNAATNAAYAAAYATNAANAAANAASSNFTINFHKLAKKALTYK